MSRVATRTPGMKDTPFFGSAKGCKALRSTSSEHTNTRIFTQVRAAAKRNTLRPALVYISVEQQQRLLHSPPCRGDGGSKLMLTLCSPDLFSYSVLSGCPLERVKPNEKIIQPLSWQPWTSFYSSRGYHKGCLTRVRRRRACATRAGKPLPGSCRAELSRRAVTSIAWLPHPPSGTACLHHPRGRC